MVKVKICGLKQLQEIEIVNNFCPDYAGFVFAPSKRRITAATAKVLKEKLNPSIQAVGVFVNEPLESLISYVKADVLDIIQLHGDEDLVYIKMLKKSSHLPIIKAIRIKDEESLVSQEELIYSQEIDHILLDNYDTRQYGGSGNSFNWQFLEKIKRPYFLAGGIGADNVREALKHKPYALDISSKVETDGIKDGAKIETFFNVLKEDGYHAVF